MPRALARDPSKTVFTYSGIISPPHDWGRWAELVGRLTRFLVERYGVDEVAEWGFEVWNEPNLEVFWSGSQDEYVRLYATAAAEQLGDDLCAVTLTGDGAGSLVDARASTTPDGTVDLLVWNGTLQQDADRAGGMLDRLLNVRIDGLRADRYYRRPPRVDETHRNIASAVAVLGLVPSAV